MICCKDKSKRIVANNSKIITKFQQVDTIFDSSKVSSTDYNFFSDSVFHGQKEILKFYLTKYKNNTCKSIMYDKSEVTNDFDGVLKLGNIRSNKKCSVFVLRPLNYCVFNNEESGDGEAYYFTDTTLPRLQTDSYCCHPSNIFLVGDIDEDGVSEIGEYSSSCTSRFKSLVTTQVIISKRIQIDNL